MTVGRMQEFMGRPTMKFIAVEEGAPHESAQVLVRLNDGTFRFGMIMGGRLANYDYHNDQYVTFAHPERITHYMIVIPPEVDTAQGAGVQSIEQAIFAAANEAPEPPDDRPEDVYA